MKKLIEKYIGSYVVKKIISENVVELELPALLKVHLVVNIRRIVLQPELGAQVAFKQRLESKRRGLFN